MNRDDIAQMMQDTAGANWGNEAHFQRFAALVAAAEREACARLCETEFCFDSAESCAKAIRARGEA